MNYLNHIIFATFAIVILPVLITTGVLPAGFSLLFAPIGLAVLFWEDIKRWFETRDDA